MSSPTTYYRVRVIDPARPGDVIVWFDDIETEAKAQHRATLTREDRRGCEVVVESRTITYSDWAPLDAPARPELIG